MTNQTTETVKPSVNIPFWAPFAKAVVAALVGALSAFLSALLPFVADGRPIGVTGWVTAIISSLVFLGGSFGVVYATPNVPKQ